MRKTTKTKVSIETEVIPVRVKPVDFKALQQDVADKQKVIDKLQADFAIQQDLIVALTERVDIIEGLTL